MTPPSPEEAAAIAVALASLQQTPTTDQEPPSRWMLAARRDALEQDAWPPFEKS